MNQRKLLAVTVVLAALTWMTVAALAAGSGIERLSGALVLSGDAVHFRDNWEQRRVPSMNVSRDQTLASLQRISTVLDDKKAQLWINHDKPQSAALRYAPAYYE